MITKWYSQTYIYALFDSISTFLGYLMSKAAF